MRRIMGVAAGAILAMAIIAAIEMVIQRIYPFPQIIDTLDRAELAAQIAAMPPFAKLLVVFGWLGGAFGGAWLALRISDWRWSGWIVAALVLAGGVANLVALPHPPWMQAGAILAPLLGGWLAERLHPRPYAGEPLLG